MDTYAIYMDRYRISYVDYEMNNLFMVAISVLIKKIRNHEKISFVIPLSSVASYSELRQNLTCAKRFRCNFICSFHFHLSLSLVLGLFLCIACMRCMLAGIVFANNFIRPFQKYVNWIEKEREKFALVNDFIECVQSTCSCSKIQLDLFPHTKRLRERQKIRRDEGDRSESIQPIFGKYNFYLQQHTHSCWISSLFLSLDAWNILAPLETRQSNWCVTADRTKSAKIYTAMREHVSTFAYIFEAAKAK